MSSTVANLPLAPAAEGAKLYADLDGTDVRIEAGRPNGLATLDEGALIPLTQLPAGMPNGLATLARDGKLPLTQLPDALFGQVMYQGLWDASSGSAPSAAPERGWYYIVNVAGDTPLDGIADWQVGDWAIFNGETWGKVDNTDAVASVAGLVGVITAQALKAALGITGLDVAIADEAGHFAASTLEGVLAEIGARLQSALTAPTVNPLSINAGAVVIDLALGEHFTLLLDQHVTSVTFANMPAAPRAKQIAIRIQQDAIGGRTLALPASFKATGGSDTQPNPAPNGYTLLTAVTFDQGTRWAYAMQEIAA